MALLRVAIVSPKDNIYNLR